MLTWPDVERRLLPPGFNFSEEQAAVWRARLTFSATFACALRCLPAGRLPSGRGAGDGGRWRVWVLGARQELEGQLAKHGWLSEPLEYLCPQNSHGWQLELIGPEMGEWRLERPAPPRASSSTSSLLRGHCATAHPPRKAFGDPDLVVAFHSGLGTLLLPLVVPWLPTLAALLASRVPILLTSYHEGESDGEEQLIGALGATALSRPIDCPVRHALPLDAIMDRAFSSKEGEARTVLAVAKHVRLAAKAEAARARLTRPPPRREAPGAEAGAAAGACAGAEAEAEAEAEAAEAEAEEAARADIVYAWHNTSCCAEAELQLRETCNSRFWWVCGADASRNADAAAAAGERAAALLRSHARFFGRGRARLRDWIGGVAKAAQEGRADEGAIYAELLAEATAEPRTARKLVSLDNHSLAATVLRYAADVARRTPQAAQRYSDVPAGERFLRACQQTLDHLQMAMEATSVAATSGAAASAAASAASGAAAVATHLPEGARGPAEGIAGGRSQPLPPMPLQTQPVVQHLCTRARSACMSWRWRTARPT